MADWYISSAAWTALPQFAASTAYTVGQVVRPLTAPAFNAQYAFRCTVAGTSTTEPAWPTGNNATIASGGATFTNVSGQATYGWGAAAGNIYCISAAATNRPVVGDRIFVSSDHAESTGASSLYTFTAAGFGVIQIISVNRAGSVPPVAGDALSGASITGIALTLDAAVNQYWQGISFTTTGGAMMFNNGQLKTNYLKNCAIWLNSTGAYQIRPSNPAKVVLDNTTVRFGAIGQWIGTQNSACDLIWINTPSAVVAAGTIPTYLIVGTSSTGFPLIFTLRGVDLSAVTTTLLQNNAQWGLKVLLDSCRIAPGVLRYGSTTATVPVAGGDEIELVNCYDGTNILSERHTPAGDLTTSRTTYMTGGAQDDSGNYAHQMVSSSRSDPYSMTLDSFWLDVEMQAVGVTRTATVEVVSSASLNNNDIVLKLEYLGTSGSSLASFVDSLASPLTATAALPTSTANWVNAPLPTWNPSDLVAATLSGANLAVTSTGTGGVRSNASYTSGKYYWEVFINTHNTGMIGVANAAVNLATVAGAGTGACVVVTNGEIYNNNADAGINIGVLSNGTWVSVALDVGNRLIWFRNNTLSGSWNATGGSANNPATGTGGISVSAIVSTGLFALACWTGTGDTQTANFGGSAFSYSVPAGFAGFPRGTPQHLQCTFTPQQAGRLRGLVRLGKPSTTCWINPQIAVT